ncbi:MULTISPECIES: cyclase family protein [Mycobacteriaceae]|jgi:kynurenine formamidase|uniref:Cyclase family protein n=2 Tax=Mycolicibacterium TaxID=1866885 RepID=A0A7I7ZMU5_9MYCO|nr:MULTISPECIES: cyclase family protein [Mycolicibacterium]OBA82302.1 cyclase [Mycolicibacterium mucogenicum]RUP34507.1 MAG: cyclase family protein [Mycolicibacterium sp.]TLH72023.1 cyclase family protein [Mycolicibacterium phocaicum]BBZ55112.1 cyclase [Mycolicibacterium phocaicum]
MLVDLSHTIRAGLVTYPGLPAPTISDHLTREASRDVYAAGTEFAIGAITMVGNTGTYIDSPFHRYENGADLAGLDLNTLVDLPTIVVHRREVAARAVVADELPDDIEAGSAVLIDTGWDRHFGTEAYGDDAPFLSEAATELLVSRGVALVGIDSVNIDDASPAAAGRRPIHTALLGNGIHVVEHLTNLAALPARGARFTAVPPRVEGFGTFPVRAYATIPD